MPRGKSARNRKVRLVLPCGVYRFYSPLVLPKDLIIVGEKLTKAAASRTLENKMAELPKVDVSK